MAAKEWYIIITTLLIYLLPSIGFAQTVNEGSSNFEQLSSKIALQHIFPAAAEAFVMKFGGKPVRMDAIKTDDLLGEDKPMADMGHSVL